MKEAMHLRAWMRVALITSVPVVDCNQLCWGTFSMPAFQVLRGCKALEVLSVLSVEFALVFRACDAINSSNRICTEIIIQKFYLV